MITVEGVDQLEHLARNLREAADHDLEKELSKALSAVTRPIVRDIRQSARDQPAAARWPEPESCGELLRHLAYPTRAAARPMTDPLAARVY